MMGIVCLISTAFLTSCRKDHNDNSAPSKQDRNFMFQASFANHGEVAAGQLAASKGMDASVRAFGQHMVAEHTKAQNELTALAAQWGIGLPSTPDTEHLQLLQRLQTLSGHAFDTAYIHSQVEDHRKALQLFSDEVVWGNNKQVKWYAAKYHPHILEHKTTAESIADKLH
jgi:putative membrane protein